MFHNKKLLITLLIFLAGNVMFSQSKSIRTLKISFQRTETSMQGETASMSGFIFYQANPYIFLFNTQEPVQQVTYINSDGAYFLAEDVLYDYTEGTDPLNQTCIDFLTWFKNDLGLSEQGYKVASCTKEDDYIVSTWLYAKVSVHPYDKIIVYSDKNGVFHKLMMYTQNDELFAETTLSDFDTRDGIFYPKRIQTTSYSNGKPYIHTTLLFTDVEINHAMGTDPTPAPEGKTKEVHNSIQKTIPSLSYLTANSPALRNYQVSEVSIITNIGFSFYKRYITAQDNSACPFTPSCSQYMREAVQKHGVLGIIMGIERLRRCTAEEHSRDLYLLTDDYKHLDPVN